MKYCSNKRFLPARFVSIAALFFLSFLAMDFSGLMDTCIGGEVRIIPLGYFGGEGNGEGEFHGARGIAVDMLGNIYVIDTGNNRVLKFSPQGKFIGSIGDFGWGQDQFDHPSDVCVALGLEIYIADSYNHRILRYDKDLNYISQYAPDDVKEEQWKFGFPLAVEMSIHGDLFILDGENKRIIRVNRLGDPSQSFAGFRDIGNILKEPDNFHISNDDMIYITDRSIAHVIVLDYYGNFVKSIGQHIFQRPMGIALDSDSRIYIADAELQRVVVVSSAGTPLGGIGPAIIELGMEFIEPVDVALDRDKLYVLDRSLSHVFIFRILSE